MNPQVLLETPTGSYPVNYIVERVPDNPDMQVAATIRRMCEYVNADCTTPQIQSDAQLALSLDPTDPFNSIHRFVRSRMEFKNDEKITEPYEGLLAKPGPNPSDDYFVECLKRPVDVSLEYARTGQKVEGDCDDWSMTCAALLQALGIECSFVTVGANAEDPTVFSHVYVTAYYGGQRVSMDTSHGLYAGWETPNLYGKFAEWPISPTSSWSGLGFAVVVAGLFAWTKRDQLRKWFA